MLKTLLLIVMILQVGCSSGSKKKTEKVKEESEGKSNVVDPVVISRIEGMGKYLRSLNKFEISAGATFDIVLENDQKTEFNAKILYRVQRPDKFFAEIKSDRKHRQYFYNGKKFFIYSPSEKLYGELEFSGPVAGLIKKLNEYGIEVPLSDLFVWGSPEAKSKNITSAIFLSEERIDNKMQDHYAIRQDKIDWQVWIQKGHSPLPMKVLYEINDDTARPKMSSVLKWNLKPVFKNGTFEFKPPKDSQKIKINPARKPEENK